MVYMTSAISRKVSCAQRQVLESGLLSTGFSCVLQMPTGSGKTWLAEEAIALRLKKNRRSIYLTPLKALATELLERWSKRFSDYSVGVFTGDFVQGKYPVPFSDAQLMIMTPEKLDACTRNWRSHWGWIPEVDLIVVDEFHLLGDPHRGGRLEGTLSRMRRLNPFVRILGLSATLGNRSELAHWLDGVEFVSTQRPIPLRWRIERYKKAQQKPDVLKRVIQTNLDQSGKSLVFVQSRRRAEELSALLSEEGIRVKHHHAGLDYDERGKVEALFRSGQLDVLIATATLEMGLNLPVRQVVLYDLQGFDGLDFVPLSVNTVWQRAGRAGRQGLDTEGEVILIAPIWQGLVEDYPLGRFEAIQSSLDSPTALAEQVIAEVASGLCRSREQLFAAMGRTLAAQQRCLPDLDRVIADMLQAEMLVIQPDEDPGRLKATKLGYVATRHMIAPKTVLQFRQCLTEPRAFTFLDFLIMATLTSDCQPIIPVDFEGLDDLADALSGEPSYLLSLGVDELTQILGIDGKRLLASFHTAMIVRTWTRTGNAVETAKLMGCYAFEVKLLQASMTRLLMAMRAVIKIVVDQPNPSASGDIDPLERLQMLSHMVQHGIDASAATLCVIDGIAGTLAKRLVERGVEDIEDLALADVDDIAKIKGISKKRASRWIEEANEMVDCHHCASRYQEEPTETQFHIPQCPSDVDLYRLRRASELTIGGREGNVYRVMGGTDPHIVKRLQSGYKCDCLDFAKGHLCKHILRVRLLRDDSSLKQLLSSLSEPENHRLDLLNLWMGVSR